MDCDIYDNAPNVATKHGYLHQSPKVISLQGCGLSLILRHIAIFLVDEVFVWIQEVTSFNIYLLD